MIKIINNDEINRLNEISQIIFNKNIINNPFSKLIVYEIENKIVGFSQYDLIYDRIEIEYIGVLKEYRNMKVASKLMNYIIEKCPNISLEVNEKNISAINLYKKFNFKIEAIREKYYNGEDAYLMVRKDNE